MYADVKPRFQTRDIKTQEIDFKHKDQFLLVCLARPEKGKVIIRLARLVSIRVIAYCEYPEINPSIEKTKSR